MAKHEPETLIEKIADMIHGHDSSSSSSDSEDDKPSKVEVVQAKIFRLFGIEKPVHKVFGGGKRILSPSFSIHIQTNNRFKQMYIYIYIYIDICIFVLCCVVWLIGKYDQEKKMIFIGLFI